MIGVHFAASSARAVVVRASDGAVVGSGAAAFPHGLMRERLLAGPRAEAGRPLTLPAGWALQVPADYAEALGRSVAQALSRAHEGADVEAERVVGIGVDLPAGAVMPVTRDGAPVCEVAGFGDHPHAYAKAESHDAARRQAWRITQVAGEHAEPWLARCGGAVPASWVFPKGLQLLEQDPAVYRAMDRFAQVGDWLVGRLTGAGAAMRGAVAAGFRAFADEAGRYPSPEFLASLNPDFADFVEQKLGGALAAPGARAGGLCASAAKRLGLPAGIAVAVAGADLPAWALGAGAAEAGQMTAIVGQASRFLVNGERLADVPGTVGVARDAAGEDLWGYEAGQRGVGDALGWLLRGFLSARYAAEAQGRGVAPVRYVEQLAAARPAGESGLVAISGPGPRGDEDVAGGLIAGATSATRVEDVYRALVESWAYRVRDLVGSFEGAGLPVGDVTLAGDYAADALVAQILADAVGRSVRAVEVPGGPALGSAIHAAVAAGIHPSVREAARAMGGGRSVARYAPDADAERAYAELYRVYRRLSDGAQSVGAGALDQLNRIRGRARDARSTVHGQTREGVVS